MGAFHEPFRTNGLVVIVYGTQVFLIYSFPYCPSQALACDLVSSKMYPTVNARVGDIIVDLLKRVYCKVMLGTAGFVNLIECPSSP